VGTWSQNREIHLTADFKRLVAAPNCDLGMRGRDLARKKLSNHEGIGDLGDQFPLCTAPRASCVPDSQNPSPAQRASSAEQVPSHSPAGYL